MIVEKIQHRRTKKSFDVKLCMGLFLIILFTPVLMPGSYSLLTRPSYVILFLISFVYYGKLLKKNALNLFLKLMLLFSLMQLFYYIFGEKVAYSFDKYGNVSPIPLYSNVVKVFSAFSSLVVVYYLKAKNKIENRDMLILFYTSLFYGILSFFGHIEDASTAGGIEVGAGELTNNAGYLFACMLPFIFLINNRKRELLFFVVTAVFIFVSAKRGAILILALFVIHYFIYSLKNTRRRWSYVYVLITLIILMGLAAFFYYFVETHPYMMGRVLQTEEGNSSGRDEMYTDMFHFIIADTSTKNRLFGFGIGTVINTIGLGSHNDWFEILISFGIMGGVI